MMPVIHLNFLAILVAIVAQMVIGFLWYGPLFGKVWMHETGKSADFKPTGGQMARATILQIVGAFLVAFVMSHSLNVWRPSVWMAGSDAPNWTYGFYAGMFTWIGFYVPLLLSGVAWEGKSWKLFFLNAAGYFISLQAVAMILAYWK